MIKQFLIAALLAAPICHAENKQDKPNRPTTVWHYIAKQLDTYLVKPCEKYRIPEIVACTCAIALPFILYYNYLLHKAHQYRLAELNKITQNQSLEVQ